MHLFPEGFGQAEEVEPIVPVPIPVRPMPKTQTEENVSVHSNTSYLSQPASTPPTPKAEWNVQMPRRARATRPKKASKAQKLQPTTVTQDANDSELDEELTERVVKHPKAYPRPDNGGGQKAVTQFHSNICGRYLTSLLHKETTGTWLDAPEVPTANELMDQNEPWTKVDDQGAVLMNGNMLDGPWPSVKVYLEAHYGMLREEAVLPLRQAISWVRAHPSSPEDSTGGSSSSTSGIGIYTKVRFTTVTFSTRGLGIRIVISLSKVGKKIRWNQSKRLIAGSLVVLTPTKDMFKTKCIVATVAARPLDLIEEEPPKLDLFLACPEDLDLDPSIEYTMIENRTSFFEAVR